MKSKALENLSSEAIDAARRVKILLMDCDGVMTDGSLYFGSDGEELKVFNVRDGQGISMWHAAGFDSGIISGRGAAKILERRAAELGMKFVRTLSRDKSADLEEILGLSGASAEEVAFIGDDVGDIPILRKVGFPVAVGDAIEDLKSEALHITQLQGGHGAVRELIELLLAAKSLDR